MNHASLFSGIGGFDLAAQWMGWKNIFHSEIDPFCNKILKYHFPNSISYGNIKETDFTPHKGGVDILTGGFPCQPFSAAGLRNGTNDSRYLWPEMFRAIREICPRWVIAENVRGLLSWNEGLVLDTVCSDLENEDYEVWPFLSPACGVNAPHQRYRIWIIAYCPNSNDWGNTSEQTTRQKQQFRNCFDKNDTSANLHGERIKECNLPKEPNVTSFPNRVYYEELPNWEKFPTQSPIRRGDDGISLKLDGYTQSIKAYGNAVVPQIPYILFKNIVDFERTLKLLE